MVTITDDIVDGHTIQFYKFSSVKINQIQTKIMIK